jgi:hypothetical protein
MSTGVSGTVLVGMMLALVGCGIDDQGVEVVPDRRIEVFDTVVSAQDGLIGMASALAMDGAGGLWVADRLAHHVVLLDDEGAVVRSIGRAGSGPGEMQRPEAVAISGTELFVFDFGNSRISRFGLEGTYHDSRRVAPRPSLPVTLNTRGDLAASAGGGENLVALHLWDQEGVHLIGEAVVPVPSGPLVISADQLRAQVLRGEMPALFRTQVLAVSLAEDGVLAVLQADGEVLRYDPEGAVVWTLELVGPEIELGRQRFVEAWERYSGSGGMPEPQTVMGVALAGHELWLATGTDETGGSVLQVVDVETGQVLRRVVLSVESPVGPFAVDADRRSIYATLPQEAVLVRADLALAR